jgi:flavin-dependent dehydrogenase
VIRALSRRANACAAILSAAARARQMKRRARTRLPARSEATHVCREIEGLGSDGSVMRAAVESRDIVIIGAGPAGSVAAGILRAAGRDVLILERETFPRFSIGESLLPQSMAYLEEAGMLRAVVEAGFQYKNGAVFVRGDRITAFDFRDKTSDGWGTTYQVQRARFDHVLAKEAERMGAEIRFRHEVTAAVADPTQPSVRVRAPDGAEYEVRGNFLLDASGFGRILPRLLRLDQPSAFPTRGAIFTHIADRIPAGAFDRDKIRITIHPEHVDVWYWLIPFSDGRSSIGVVARADFLARYAGTETERLRALVFEDPASRALLGEAAWDTPARQIVGYASNVSALSGPGFALLGNAGEFLDPVFSSGVTIAFRSASLACGCLARTRRGEVVDWPHSYDHELRRGVDTFRAFVESWYSGGFQKIIFFPAADPGVRRQVCSILAGYAWDDANPFVRDSVRGLAVLERVCE